MLTRRQPPRAFTLIELLVVVAIITVLVSVIMPALSGAKIQNSRTKCMANLRELAKVAIMYAQDDPRDILGPIHRASKDFILEGYAHYGGGPGDMPYQAWDDPFDPRTRPFNWIIYGGPDAIVKNTAPGDRREFVLFQCPGDDFGWQEWPNMGSQPQETERSYYFGNGTSYRMNNLSDVQGVPSLAQIAASGSSSTLPMSLGIYGRPSTRIPDSAKVVCFLEARAFQTMWTNNVWGALNAGELTGCHQKLGFFNLAYADGHVAYVDMGDDTFFPRNEKYKNLDVRGMWGQLDCFPADPLPEP